MIHRRAPLLKFLCFLKEDKGIFFQRQCQLVGGGGVKVVILRTKDVFFGGEVSPAIKVWGRGVKVLMALPLKKKNFFLLPLMA